MPERSASRIDDRDLQTAGHLQRMLLPPTHLLLNGWEAAHVFQSAGVVSGDYVDLVAHGDGLYFMLGDVSGKGVAAALLMAQLHAMFRTLVAFHLPLEELMARASALLCASSLPTQYATLVCGFLEPSGDVAIVNAGHPPPLIVAGGSPTTVRATGIPMGLFCESTFSSTRLMLTPDDALLIYTDGLSEGRNVDGEEYGAARIEATAALHAQAPLVELVSACVSSQAAFRGASANEDDLTVLTVRRATGEGRRLDAPASVCATRDATASGS